MDRRRRYHDIFLDGDDVMAMLNQQGHGTIGVSVGLRTRPEDDDALRSLHHGYSLPLPSFGDAWRLDAGRQTAITLSQ